VNYWQLDAIFLAIVAAVGIVAAIRGRRRGWPAVLITAGVLLLVSAVFDNVMIGIGLVGYNRAEISGLFIGIAPLEDFAYAIAAAVLLPSLWMLFERQTR
jgi:lycopene cyclase domain-containing protein